MITEDYCSYEVAKILKDKGFNEPFYFFYRTDDKIIHHAVIAKPLIYCDKIDEEVISAPTIQMVMKWLREVHNQNIIFDMLPEGNDCYALWTFNIISNKNYKIIWGNKKPKYNTYEQASEAAIKYCLENLI